MGILGCHKSHALGGENLPLKPQENISSVFILYFSFDWIPISNLARFGRGLAHAIAEGRGPGVGLVRRGGRQAPGDQRVTRLVRNN